MKLDAYIRVSRTRGRTADDPTLLGPQEQREEIERLASGGRFEINWHPPELNSTGSKLSRPIFDEILERIRTKRSDGIALASTSRFSRAIPGEAMLIVNEILKHGGKVAIADLDIDPSSPMGEAMLSVVLTMSRLQWRESQAKHLNSRKRATARGAFVGPAPRGYEKGEYGLLFLNDDAPKVREVFEAAAEGGIGGAKVVAERHWPDLAWSTSNVRKLLTKRVYKGVAYSGEFVSEDVVPAIVSAEVWALAQPGESRGRKPDGDFPLSKIATCAGCGTGLTGYRTSRNGRARGMRCRGADCTARPHIYAAELEDLVLERIRAAGDVWGKTVSLQENYALYEGLLAAQAKLDTFLATPRADDMEQDEWDAQRKALKAAVQAAREASDASAAASAGLPDLDDETPAVRRAAFELTIASLTVAAGRGNLGERVDLSLTA